MGKMKEKFGKLEVTNDDSDYSYEEYTKKKYSEHDIIRALHTEMNRWDSDPITKSEVITRIVMELNKTKHN